LVLGLIAGLAAIASGLFAFEQPILLLELLRHLDINVLTILG